MRTTIFILTIILLGTVSFNKATSDTVTVIKDCTGTYLRLNDKDHRICNADKLDKYESGAVVDASFVKDEKCVSDRKHCAMVHNHEIEVGLYRVTKIK